MERDKMTVEQLLRETRMYPGCVSAGEAAAELGKRCADAQRALDAEREKVKELERDNAAMKQLFHANPSALWGQLASLQAQLESANVLIYKKNCALGRADTTITDLQAQLAAAKKVKADYDRWLSGGVYFTTAEYEKHIAEHQAQLRQVEGQSKQQAEEAVIVFAKYTTLQQLLEDVLHTFGYLRFHRVAGMDGLLYETHNKMSPERTVEACEKRIRATLAAQSPAAGGARHGDTVRRVS